MKLTFITRISIDCENVAKGKKIIQSMVKYQSLFNHSKSISIEFVRTIINNCKSCEEKSLVQKMNEKMYEIIIHSLR